MRIRSIIMLAAGVASFVGVIIMTQTAEGTPPGTWPQSILMGAITRASVANAIRVLTGASR